MSAETKNLLEELARLAAIAKEALLDAVDANDDGKVDLRDVIALVENGDLKSRFESLLGQTKRKQVLASISVVLDRQEKLVNGRSLFALSADELNQYTALGETRRMLFTMARKIESDRNAFLAWFSDYAIDVILKVVRVVIPVV